MEGDKLKPVLIVSDDGSHTLKVAELKEHYHSHKGALQESEYVFISKGLKASGKTDLHILEVGFGTGLNALLTALQTGITVDYVTLEPFPVANELIGQLNYPMLLEHPSSHEVFQAIHEAAWDEDVMITPSFKLNKNQKGLEDFESDQEFDLVYYDAFAPHAQPELWESWVWEKLYRMIKVGGSIVTYCAKGQVRRDMQSAGFSVERLDGPPGKREMLRAAK